MKRKQINKESYKTNSLQFQIKKQAHKKLKV